MGLDSFNLFVKAVKCLKIIPNFHGDLNGGFGVDVVQHVRIVTCVITCHNITVTLKHSARIRLTK